MEVEDSLWLMLSRRGGDVDRERLDAAVDRIASRRAEGLSIRGRRQLARSWFLLYELGKRELGSASEALGSLRVAAQLDPEEASYAKELAFQERRQAQIQARLDEAADYRAGYVWERGDPDLQAEGEGGQR